MTFTKTDLFLTVIPFPGYVITQFIKDEKGEMFSMYSKQPISELFNEYTSKGESVEIVNAEKLEKLFDDHEKSLITDPIEITSERFFDLLEVLPPARWGHTSSVEHFHIIERITGNLVTWCAKYQGKCFSFDDLSTVLLSTVSEKVKKAFNALKGGN